LRRMVLSAAPPPARPTPPRHHSLADSSVGSLD
jgi:hypothetical protein